MKKQQLIIYIGLILTMISCSVFNADLRYKPNSTDEYYFPLLSAEFTNRQNDCIEKKKFPCNFPKPNDTLDEFLNQWYSRHLKSMKELILYKLQKDNKKIIRFTHLGTWSNPYSYRIENSNGQITLTYSKTKGLGGYGAGRRIKYEQKIIKSETWEKILEKINSANFWSIETHDPNMILDGEEWILEVLIDGKYHFVTRNSPENFGGKEYSELCKIVMNADK
jgi:hypothetical protein